MLGESTQLLAEGHEAVGKKSEKSWIKGPLEASHQALS